MDHPSFHQNLGLAGVASMNGGRRKGANAVLRSPRQKRRAHQQEMQAAIRAFERKRPDIVPPQTDEEIERLRKSDRDFAALCRRMEALAEKWS